MYKSQYDEIKKLITDKDQKAGIVLPGKQRWSLRSPEELTNRFPEQNESDQVVIWNAVYLTTPLVKCSRYSYSSDSVTGSCLANGFGYETTISGCKGHNWGVSTLCMYGDEPSTWTDPNGVNVASGYSYNERYLFGTVDLLRNSDDLSYKTISGINGNFLDTNISKDTRIRYSIDVFKDNPGMLSFKVRTYGRSFWEVYLDDNVVNRASSINAQISQGSCYVTSGSWHTISIKYLALDEESGLNRIEFTGDLFKQVDRYRTVAPVDAPTILSVSDEEYQRMIQIDWQNGYWGSGAFTAIYASGSTTQTAQLSEWTMLDIVPISITSYGDTDLLEGEERYYQLRHISSDGDLSPYSNVMSGKTISYIQPRLATIKVVADGDDTRDSSQRTGCFSSEDTIYIYVKSPVPLDSYPDVWVRVPISELSGTYFDTLATPTDKFDDFYTETVHSLSLGSFTSANDGLGMIIISGTSYSSAEHWNLTNTKRFFLLDHFTDAPNSIFTLDNLTPTAADSLSIPDIELYTGETYTEDGSYLAGSRDLIIKPSRDSSGRANVIDDESKSVYHNSNLYQARFLISGAGLSISEGGSQDWSSWEPYSEGGTKLISLPDLIDSTAVDYSTIYIWAQFRDRALNSCVPVYATLEVDTSPPLPPTGLSAEGGMNIITLNWDKNFENDIKHYRVYGSNTNSPEPISSYTGLGDEYPKIATSNFYIDSVSGDTRRYYQIVAVDTGMNTSIGNGTHPIASGITVDTVPPSAPLNLLISSWSSTDSNNLSQISYIGATWNNNSEDDMDGYYLQYVGGNEQGWDTAEIDYVSTDLVASGIFLATPGLYYSVRVQAFDTLGNTSDPSDTKYIIASGDITPPKALDYFVLSGSTYLSVEGFSVSQVDAYVSPDDTDLDINRIECELVLSGSTGWSLRTVNVTGPSSIYKCTYQGLLADSWYLVRARAIDNVGNLGPMISGYVKGGRDLAAPDPPSNLEIDPLLEALSLRWDSSPSADTAGYVILRGESDEQTITYGTLTNNIAQGDYTAVLTLVGSPTLPAGCFLSIDPHGANEDNVLITSFNDPTDTVTVQTPFKLAHLAGTTFKIYYTRALAWGTSLIDQTSTTEYYNIAARDVSGNVSDLAYGVGAWVSETPSSEADASIAFDFLADQTTINILKNSSFEIGSGTLDADKRDIFWDDYKGTPITQNCLTNYAVTAPFGDYIARIGYGDAYSQIVRVAGGTPYVLSFYGGRSSLSSDIGAQIAAYISYSIDGNTWDAPINASTTYLTGALLNIGLFGWNRYSFYNEATNGGYTTGTYHRYAKIILSGYNTSGTTKYGLVDGVMFQAGNNLTQYVDYSDEFVLGTECITSTEITSGSITTPKLAAESVLSRHILAGQIGTHHLTVMGKPYYFSFDIHPNKYWVDTVGGEEEYNHLGLIWSGGSIILCSGAGEVGDTATNVWVEQTVPSGGQILTGNKTYYLYFDYEAVGIGNFRYEPVAGGTTTIGITDQIGQTVNPATLNRRLFGRIQTYTDARDMDFTSIGAGTIVDGDSIRTGSLQARAIMAGTITGTEIHGETITGDKLVMNTLMGDTIISAIGESSQVIGAANLPSSLGDVTAPSWSSFYFTCSGTTAGTVNLWWSPASDASGVKGYRIWRALGQFTTWDGIPSPNAELIAELEPASVYDAYWGSSPAYIDTNTTSGQYYTYFISAYDIYSNESEPAPRINALKYILVTDTTGPSGAPTITKLYPGNGRLTVEWTEPTLSSNTDIVQYRIDWSKDGTNFSTIGYCRDTKFIHFLDAAYQWTSGTYPIYHANWKYRIYSIDKYNNPSVSYGSIVGTSATTQAGIANSTGVDYVPCDGTKPTAPASLTATAGVNADITLSWPRSTSTDVEGYRLYVWEHDTLDVPTLKRSFCYTIRSLYNDATTVNYVLTGLTPKTGYPPDSVNNNYCYTISGFAYDAQGNLSDASSNFKADLVYATDSTGPTPVTGIILSYIPFGVKIAWTGSSATDVDKYVIKVRTNGTVGVADGVYPSWTSNFDRQIIVDANQMAASASYSTYDMGLETCSTTNYGYSYAIYAVDYYGNVNTTMTAASQDWIQFDSSSQYAFGTNVVSGWKHPTDHTYIQGGKIYTGSIKADSLEVNRRAYDTNIRFDLNSDGTTITPQCTTLPITNAFIFPYNWANPISGANLSNFMTVAIALNASSLNFLVFDTTIPGTNPFSILTQAVYQDSSHVQDSTWRSRYLVIGTIDTRSSPPIIVFPVSPGTTIDGAVITTGYINSDRIETNSLTTDKLSVTHAGYETNGRLACDAPVSLAVRPYWKNDTLSSLYLRIRGRTTDETVTLWPQGGASFIKKPSGTNYFITGTGDEFVYVVYSGGAYGNRFYSYSPTEYNAIVSENALCYTHIGTLEFRNAVLQNIIGTKGTFINGDSIRTGTLDVSRTVAVNADTEHPIYVGKVTTDVGGNSGLTVLGDWTATQTPSSLSIPAGRGLVIAHGKSYTLVDSNGFYRTDSSGVARNYGTYSAIHECGILPVNIGESPTSYFGSVGTNQSADIYRYYWIPSGGANDLYGSSIGDGLHVITAPEYVVDYLNSLSDAERRNCIHISPGMLTIMAEYNTTNACADVLGRAGAWDYNESSYETVGMGYIDYGYSTVHCRLLSTGNFSRESATTFRVRVEACVKYYYVNAVESTNAGSNYTWSTIGGLYYPAIGTPARGGLQTVFVNINV